MKVRLIRDSRITVKAGETVEVSSAVADFLLSVGSAVKAEENPVKRSRKKNDKDAEEVR